jgi:hypothetical protein
MYISLLQHVSTFEKLAKRGQCTKNNIEALSCKHCCSGKAISIIYSEYVLWKSNKYYLF